MNKEKIIIASVLVFQSIMLNTSFAGNGPSAPVREHDLVGKKEHDLESEPFVMEHIKNRLHLAQTAEETVMAEHLAEKKAAKLEAENDKLIRNSNICQLFIRRSNDTNVAGTLKHDRLLSCDGTTISLDDTKSNMTFNSTLSKFFSIVDQSSVQQGEARFVG